MRPPPPEWLIERGLQKTNLMAVHAGNCWTVRKSSRCVGVSQAQAPDALRRRQKPLSPQARGRGLTCGLSTSSIRAGPAGSGGVLNLP
ncbi:DUF6233 domain-containing protein [Streptomyces sp. NPDC003343]